MAYQAQITRLKDYRKDENSNNLYTATVLGEGVIVGPNGYEGQPVVYFPAGGALQDMDFVHAFKLLRTDGGYLDPACHIKAIKIRGLRSEGLAISVDEFAKYYEVSADYFREGDCIDSVNGILICKKYLPTQQFATSNKNKISHKGKQADRITYPYFYMHEETAQLAYNEGAFREGDNINMSLKVHGTSQRTALTLAQYQKGFWRRLFHMRPKTRIADVLGTRRTIVTSPEGGYYGSDDFRLKHHDELLKVIDIGMEIFYEVVGYASESKFIMPPVSNAPLKDKEFIKKFGLNTEFTYGCEPGQSEMYIYRITSDDGKREWTPQEIETWCISHGFKQVPQIDNFTFTNWDDLQARINKYFEELADPIDNRHLKEGVVIRIVNRNNFAAYKSKTMEFKVLSGIAMEKLVQEGGGGYSVEEV